MQTRDQKLALAVYTRVQKISDEYNDKQKYKQYGGLAHKLPILIRTAGLAQALAFVEARCKQNPLQRRLLEDLAGVLGEQELVKRSRSVHFSEYIQLTQQALDALLWFKRYAQSVLDVQSGEGEDDER